MTVPVDFHTGVADPVAFACRLLRKACRQGARVLVTAPPPTAGGAGHGAVDLRCTGLRAASAPAGAGGPGAAHTDLAVRGRGAGRRTAGCCVNLGAEPPQDPSEVDRVIEIVGEAPQERLAARERWRHYEQAWGVTPEHHVAAG